MKTREVIMIAEGQKFVGKRIFLDGSSFTKCRFERCTMIYSGHLGMEMKEPEFVDCRWEIQGPAKETLKFLRALYRAGAKDLVEATFDAVRGVKPKGSRPTLN